MGDMLKTRAKNCILQGYNSIFFSLYALKFEILYFF